MKEMRQFIMSIVQKMVFVTVIVLYTFNKGIEDNNKRKLIFFFASSFYILNIL